MSNVEFEDEKVMMAQVPKQEIRTAMESLFIKTGFIKTKAQANAVMVLLALSCFALSIFVIVKYIF